MATQARETTNPAPAANPAAPPVPPPPFSRLTAWQIALETPWAKGLVALLAVQILLILVLAYTGRGALAPAALDSPLLTFDPKAVTAVRIEGGSDGTVTLTKSGKDWQLADPKGFPADSGKVESLLDKLAAVKRPLPIATSAEAMKRHKVADEGFERKVTLEADGKPVATLIMGSSPGFRRSFARPAGESAVYDIEFPAFEVGNKTDDWVARDLLRVDRESIQSVSTKDWTLDKGKDGWQLKGDDKAPDQTAVDRLLDRLSTLSYRGVLGTQDKPEYNQSAPILEIRLGLLKGGERSLRISQVKDGKDFVLKEADKPWYLKLSEFDLEGVKDVDRAKLAGEKQPEAASGVKAPATATSPEVSKPTAEAPPAPAKPETAASPQEPTAEAKPPAAAPTAPPASTRPAGATGTETPQDQ